jgi:CRP/FNR family cyclic AMP-dependent transcriptional regulator
MAGFRLHRDERVTLLRGVSLFSSCSNEELRRIATLVTLHEVPQGSVLSEQGHAGLEFFVIVEGSANATRNSVRLARLGPGSFFGELALLDGGTRTATVVAETDMRLLVFSRREFSQLHASSPGVAYKMLAELGARLRKADSLFDGDPPAGLAAFQSI